MKFQLTFVLFLMAGITLTAQQKSADYLFSDLQEAQTFAQDNNTFVLVVYTGSDWNRKSAELEENVLSTKKFAKFAQKFVAVMNVDLPSKNELSDDVRARNEVLIAEYNPQRKFPKAVLLDAKGALVGDVDIKATTPEAFIESMQSLVR